MVNDSPKYESAPSPDALLLVRAYLADMEAARRDARAVADDD